ncbi:hypothetical protein EYV94_21425 [Puteibacter caeruleilacunae]|nr:hypothetical protein EYV94_21425 [Puteibacter caeruleilacunae]
MVKKTMSFMFVLLMMISFSSFANQPKKTKKLTLTEDVANDPYFKLLKEWCDGMLKYQITQPMGEGLEGGLMCPDCSRIHGRCFDAVYPLMCMADLTGDAKYLEGAKKLQDWAKHVLREDGSWGNDPIITTWNYTTTFSVIALGEAIYYHGHVLDEATLKDWNMQLDRAAQWVYDHLHFQGKPVINYPVSAAGALAVAGRTLDNDKYLARAKELAHEAITYFTEENYLLYGEGKPYRGITAHGCRPIDVGYNIEESIPNLLIYAEIAHDEKVKDIAVKALKSHLEFMVPDGAWDNSWGSRNYKWTYWGSRTSDGCQVGYGVLGDEDPMFAEASLRNLELLQQCTHDGLLYGGPHYVAHDMLPCIHHTFCHAKACAAVLDAGQLAPKKRVKLPRELASGVKEYNEIGTYLAAKGPWRSTFTRNDWVTGEYYVANASGGALTLLWHEKVGPVLASCLIGVTNREPTNIQMNFDEYQTSPTPRIEMVIDGETYYSVKDFDAKVTYNDEQESLAVTVKGQLVDKEQNKPATGDVGYTFTYLFKDNTVNVNCKLDAKSQLKDIRYFLPVVSVNTEKIKLNGKVFEVNKEKGKLKVVSSVNGGLYKDQERVFNTEPGFEIVPLVYNLESGELNLDISVE